MELEQAVLEAIKQKLEDTFRRVKINVNTDGKQVNIVISLPDDIGKIESDMEVTDRLNLNAINAFKPNRNLDKEAQAAQDELLGTQAG